VKRIVVVGLLVVTSGCFRDWDGALDAAVQDPDAGKTDAGANDGGTQVGDAGEPLSGADTSGFPNAGKVISVFGSNYPAVPGIIWNESFSVINSEISDVNLADGRAVKRFDLHHYTSLGVPAHINASSMNYLHVDLWFVRVPEAFEVRLVEYYTGPDGGVAPVNSYWLPPLIERTWLSFEIPLVDFMPPASPRDGIGQMLWLCRTGSRQDTPSSEHYVVYLDNLFFHQ
jgi:hypothetical protein